MLIGRHDHVERLSQLHGAVEVLCLEVLVEVIGITSFLLLTRVLELEKNNCLATGAQMLDV